MAGARVTEPRVVGEHARRHRVVFSAALTASRLWAPVSWPVAAITRPVPPPDGSKEVSRGDLPPKEVFVEGLSKLSSLTELPRTDEATTIDDVKYWLAESVPRVTEPSDSQQVVGHFVRLQRP